MTKNELKNKVGQNYISSGGFLGVYHATGSGKSSCAVECIRLFRQKNTTSPILIVCHSTNARDVDWPQQLQEWGGAEIANDPLLKLVCYKSLITMTDPTDWGLIVLDEAHYITGLSFTFFKTNTYQSLVALTATYPEEEDKQMMLNFLTKDNAMYYELETAINDKVLNDYEFFTFMVSLNETKKYVKLNKYSKKLVTEREFYDSLEAKLENSKKQIENIQTALINFVVKHKHPELEDDSFKCLFQAAHNVLRKIREKEGIEQNKFIDPSKHALSVEIGNLISLCCTQFATSKFTKIERMHFIYNLQSKVWAGQHIANKLRANNRRFLMFCSNKNQADQMSQYRLYTGHPTDDYKRFLAEEIPEIASCKKIKEGANIKNLDAALLIQIQSKARSLTQILGRLLRREIGYVSRAYGVVAKGTIDEVWYRSAITGIDQSKIKEIPMVFK